MENDNSLPLTSDPLVQKKASLDEEVHDYLMQLDLLREECERTGDFVRAQQCVNRMRDINLRHAKRIETISHQANVDAKTGLSEEHKLEILTFTRMWDDKLADYDDHSRMISEEVRMKHVQDYQQQEGILKVQLMNRRPKFSKKVVETRALLERFIQQRQYLEAEEVKKKLQTLEEQELMQFDDSLAVTFERKTQSLKQQYVGELKAVEQKIKMGREELITQRKIDFEKLLRRHANALRDLDQQTKIHIAKTRQYVHRQVKALVKDPVKTAMDLRGVADTSRDMRSLAKAKAQRGSLQRARTPTTTASSSSMTPQGGGYYGGSPSSTASFTHNANRNTGGGKYNHNHQYEDPYAFGAQSQGLKLETAQALEAARFGW